jgi:glyoxylase-like metal-dependent hydrolase (beta-lactamase superfamily II)
MTLRISFHGGAGTVTGSRHLVETATRRIQIDAGLFQRLKELRLLHWRKPSFDAASVDHLLLTHAHIDHSGALPRLVREGFEGPVHCTPATRELVEILLLDSAEIQEQDADYARRKGFSEHDPLPLYTVKDARRALRLLEASPWERWIELGDGARARFVNAGHILGSGFIELRAPLAGRERALVFSGDVGRYDMPLHVDPRPRPPCDVLVVESTYGNRLHERDPLEEQISEPFLRTLEGGGVVLIPSFAVSRAQHVILILHGLMKGEAAAGPDPPRQPDGGRRHADLCALPHRGDGVYGAVLVAALGASLPAAHEFDEALERALEEIPGDSRAAEAARLGRTLAGRSDAVDVLHERYADLSPVHTVNNLALVIWAIASFSSFDEAVGEVVAAGWDTDCNGATVGGLWGIAGREVPQAWTAPWQGRVAVQLAGVGELPLDDLVSRTVSVAQRLASDKP